MAYPGLSQEVELLKRKFLEVLKAEGVESVQSESVLAALEDGGLEDLNEIECFWLKEALNQMTPKNPFQSDLEQVVEAIWLSKKNKVQIPAFVRNILKNLYG